MIIKYINTLDKSQLISLLSAMNENELKELLHNLDNDTFIKYIAENQPHTKVKKWILIRINYISYKQKSIIMKMIIVMLL